MESLKDFTLQLVDYSDVTLGEDMDMILFHKKTKVHLKALQRVKQLEKQQNIQLRSR